MGKFKHEFRDPIHNCIYVYNDERKVIDSKYFQRLRYIHQLALTYLVYPGASHKRFPLPKIEKDKQSKSVLVSR